MFKNNYSSRSYYKSYRNLDMFYYDTEKKCVTHDEKKQ